MDRRAYLATAGAALLPPVAGCLAGGLSESEYDVGMTANAFVPDRLEIGVGDTVVWGNNGSRSHTVTAYDGGLPDGADFFASGGFENTESARDAWNSGGGGDIVPGETYEHTFETPGEHNYFCIPHERDGMVGVVVVTE
ncbi:cupredoxin domain-containing protein [Natronomonas marina]|jgi:plastocyanin|uniref:cupredoxin domain-containing protein n=1 Tax=Natronomonas marina TaxID=2961939 RepID=UPI0020C9713F|nr:plastocyanin/azurin family copper-binding protein [Natronomonas marina]